MKLTNTMRDNILSAEKQLKFKERLDKAEQAFRKELEKQVKAMSKSENVTQKVLQDLVLEGFVNTSNYVQVNIQGNKKSFNLDNYYPQKCHSSTFYIAESEAINELHLAWDKIKSEAREFTSKLSSVLYGYNTDKQLIEALPEMIVHF